MTAHTLTLTVTTQQRWTRAETDALVVYVAAGVPDCAVEVVPDARYGPVESAYRAWIRGLGRLSPRQAAVAEHVYALAGNIDKAQDHDAPAAAVASLSRALVRAADTLPSDRPEQPETPAEVPDRPPTPDEVARKRAERRAGRGAAS